ncbi:MAG: cache domain-containing protein [Deltaproteobacteria bacterium]|nr:cache domain-containing protein [Deltaproteobacteria bacterium]
MKISLSKRLFLGFLIVIITICALMSFVGLRLIDTTIVARIQDKVRLDLRSGRDLYEEEVANIRETVRLSALGLYSLETSLDTRRDKLADRLSRIAEREGLDILTLTGPDGSVLCRPKNIHHTRSTQSGRELVKRVFSVKTAIAFTLVLGEEDLMEENPAIVRRAFVRVVPSPYLESGSRDHVSSGMAIVAAARVVDEQENLLGVLYGGRLLNNSPSLVDRITKKVYGAETHGGKDVGLATIFLSDIRIATTVKGENQQRALGTVVSDDVHDHVLKQGRPWISRPFAVNSRYVTAYEPIRDMDERIVGMLSIGVLEDRFRDIQRNAFWSFLLITMGGLGLSLVLCYFLIRSTMSPIRSLVHATQKLAEGHLEEQVHLEDSPPEIATLGRSFNSMAQSIRERDRELRFRAQEEVMKSERLAMIGQLAAGVAHEINNPLGSILLFNRLVLNKCSGDSPMRPNLERIEREVKRCQNIVQGLLEFARQREPKAEPTDLNALLDKTVALFENQPMFHNIEVARQFEEDLPEAIVDPTQIQQVFVNIIMNAVDAMEGKGRMTITTRFLQETDTCEVGFGDTGSGMPKEVLNRIFEPFYTTKGVGHGTGLGLSISYGIVQGHGGDIMVSSKAGEGSLFVVCLPRKKRGASCL